MIGSLEPVKEIEERLDSFYHQRAKQQILASSGILLEALEGYIRSATEESTPVTQTKEFSLSHLGFPIVETPDMLDGKAVCRLAFPHQQERQMDLNLPSDSSNVLHQILAASLVNAVYTRMLLYGNEPPDEPLAEASREVMSLWRGLVGALEAVNQPPDPDAP